jgi:branched-chain amino acid aminotransferase
VFDLAKEMGVKAEATDMEPERLSKAKEAFLSTTAGAIIPVTRVNDNPLGNGAPGLMTDNLRNLYWQKRREGWHGTTVDSLLN